MYIRELSTGYAWFKKTMENQGKTQRIVIIQKLYFFRGYFIKIVEKRKNCLNFHISTYVSLNRFK